MSILVILWISAQSDIERKTAQYAALQSELKQVQLDNEELHRFADEDGLAAYKERKAREQGYAKPNEQIFHITKS